MRRALALLATTAVLASCGGTPAQCRSIRSGDCIPYRALGEPWMRAYGEQPYAVGLSHNGTVLQVMRADDGRFSIFKVTPAGMACLVDYGQGFEIVPRRDQLPGNEQQGNWWDHPSWRSRYGTEAKG